MNNNILWEEKNSIEPMKNYGNKNKKEISDTTKITRKEFLKRGWKDIGKIKRKSKSLIVIGKKYNKLTPVELFCLDSKGRKLYKVVCECGNKKIIYGYLINLGIIKSCGCLHRQQMLSEFGKIRRLDFGEASKKSLFKSYQKGARKRNLKFELSFNVFISLTQKRCGYCNSLPSNESPKRYYGSVLYNGLDRIDNSKGYLIDNVISCCHQCNQAKSNLTLKTFHGWIRNIYNTTILKVNL